MSIVRVFSWSLSYFIDKSSPQCMTLLLLYFFFRHFTRLSDLPAKSQFLVSGAADNTMKLWQVSTGKCLYTWEFTTAVRRVAFSEDDDQIVCITEQRMGYQGAIRIFNINRDGDGRDREFTLPYHIFRSLCFSLTYSNVNELSRTEDKDGLATFYPVGSKISVCTFAHTSNLILTGHESGKVALFDAKTGEEVLNNERAHMDIVTDLQLSPDRSYFITSSKDKTARVRNVFLVATSFVNPACSILY